MLPLFVEKNIGRVMPLDNTIGLLTISSSIGLSCFFAFESRRAFVRGRVIRFVLSCEIVIGAGLARIPQLQVCERLQSQFRGR